jgi:hypothetical protein
LRALSQSARDTILGYSGIRGFSALPMIKSPVIAICPAQP